MADAVESLYITAVSLRTNIPGQGFGLPVPAVKVATDWDSDCFTITESELDLFINKMKETMSEARAFVLEEN